MEACFFKLIAFNIDVISGCDDKFLTCSGSERVTTTVLCTKMFAYANFLTLNRKLKYDATSCRRGLAGFAPLCLHHAVHCFHDEL